ncbi:hypothetical protein CN952_21780 [Bacillus cereus]|uniref:DUF4411 family protein n=1 Tax=Bacillus cereus TaxID=1396 RepID=UPI000BFB4938|nr:DUF4411 family protein [Bacillus cereus]PGM69896.1 hypothetical protein CN952_21780 [Bacillus cereus]PGN13511.1 hypothetical protein CN954_10935 [Bacillus cereus]
MEIKTDYLIDTDLIKHAANSKYEKKKKLRQFWEWIREEVKMDRGTIFTSDEIIHQIKVEEFKFIPKQDQEIKEILQELTSLAYFPSISTEHIVRMAASYLKNKYSFDFELAGLKIEYPDVSQTRVILTALEKDIGTIVTNKTDKFLVFLFLGGFDDIYLLNPLTDEQVTIPVTLYEKICNDDVFRSYQQEVQKYLYGNIIE